MNTEPLLVPKLDYAEIVDRISVRDSPVGIDAQYTHAIIITYLQQISLLLAKFEADLVTAGIVHSQKA